MNTVTEQLQNGEAPPNTALRAIINVNMEDLVGGEEDDEDDEGSDWELGSGAGLEGGE